MHTFEKKWFSEENDSNKHKLNYENKEWPGSKPFYLGSPGHLALAAYIVVEFKIKCISIYLAMIS